MLWVPELFGATNQIWVLRARCPRAGRISGRGGKAKAERESGPERWARWAAMVADGMTKVELARAEG